MRADLPSPQSGLIYLALIHSIFYRRKNGAKMAKNKKKLRVAFIGAGGIAGAHMRYFKEMEDVEMVAASDVVAKSVEARCEEFGIGESFTDYNKMLKTVKPDAVSVCTPNGLHAPC